MVPDGPLAAGPRLTAARINLVTGGRYRLAAAPLFAVWDTHPAGVEDVVATP